jgi:hypothetical protein
MKFKYLLFALMGVLFTAGYAQAKGSLSEDFTYDGSLYNELGINLGTIIALESHPVIAGFGLGGSIPDSASAMPPDPIADYETPIPHATQPVISPFEKAVLTAYLNNPSDVRLAKFLAIYHLPQSLLKPGPASGEKVKHTIIAQYFLNRARDLGSNDKWIGKALEKTGKKLDAIKASVPGVSIEEGNAAHQVFIDAFNYHEENRYIAQAAMLDDFVKHPNNVYTAVANNAINLWNGGEADYADPTVLYNFVVGAYFSVYAMDLAHREEQLWQQNPSQYSRFRLVTILGGFSISHRRWLAKLHGDDRAVALLDDEHRAWYKINPLFHVFTIGMEFFQEPENWQEGFNNWFDVIIVKCNIPVEQQSVTCLNRPRFTFNTYVMLTTFADYLMKAGNFGFAQGMLAFASSQPDFNAWDIGKPAWEHRWNNLPDIYANYQNGDPSDDPLPFLLKSRKWGPDMATCQTCHQAQSKYWTEEEKKDIKLPNEEYATVGNWPVVSTTWYGASR